MEQYYEIIGQNLQLFIVIHFPNYLLFFFSGMEAILFGELLTSVDILDYMLLPRLLAVAERAWHEGNLMFLSS